MNLKYVINHLVSQLENSGLYKAGEKDEKLNKKQEAIICDFFERYVTACDGDNIPEFFKLDESGVVFGFNGKFFEYFHKEGLQGAIKKTMKKLQIGIVYQKNSYEKIAKECALELGNNESCAFIPDRNYIVFNNCVMNLETGKISGHSIDIKTDIILDFNYDPKAKCPRWDTFLDEILPNKEIRGVLQEFCGAFLVDRKQFKIENICYLVGTGLNGKSVFMDAIRSCFSKDVISSFSPEQLFKSNTSQYNIAACNGKIANISDDVSNKDISGGEFKAFVSGAPFQARNPYGKPFEATRIPLLMCAVNAIPITSDDTIGHHRRPLPIMFQTSIDEKDIDTTLTTQFSTESARAHILNWVLEGRKRFIDNKGKFTRSDLVKQAQEDLKNDSNSARRWIRDSHLIPIKPENDYDPRIVSLKSLYSQYMEYCKDIQERNTKSITGLGNLLSNEKFIRYRKRDGSYYAVGILADLSEAEQEMIADNDLPF